MKERKQFRWRADLGRRLTSGALAFLLSVSLLSSAVFAADGEEASASQALPTGQAAGITSEIGYDQLYSGFYYGEETVQNSAGGAVNTFVAKVDHSADNLAVVTGVPGNKTPLEAGRRQTVSGQANAARAAGQDVLGAVNADFFYINDDTAIQPEGVCIKDGMVLKDYTEGSYFFGIEKDGTPVIGDETVYNSVSGDLQEAVSGRNLLVQDGGNLAEGETSAFYTDCHPRTAVGITEDDDILLVVADGRSSASAGLSLSDLADYMISLGAVTAMNLDGGGSSTMVVKDADTEGMEVRNVPSDGSERPCGNSLLIIDKDSAVDNTVDLSKDSDGYYLIGSGKDLAEVGKAPQANYRLNADITASETVCAAFSGAFDGSGQGHSSPALRHPFGQS